MTEVNLTQADADQLLHMPKERVDDTQWSFSALGSKTTIPLISPSSREEFLLDLWQGGIQLSKYKYQNRARKVVILARLDIGGAPHQNPDGEVVQCPHLHLYRENDADHWAYPLDSRLLEQRFDCDSDEWKLLEDFMRFCNITRPPIITRLMPS